MSGIILLAALALCLWGCIWLANQLGNLAPTPKWRTAVKVGIFIALLVSPFVDEVIGKHQFEALCKANGIEGADVSKARGKRVRSEYASAGLVRGTIIPISVDVITYRDADSGEVLMQYKNFYAFGGWLMRYTPLSMGSHHAMLFPGNGCSFSATQRVRNAAQITVIN